MINLTNNEITQLEKQKSHAFGKDVYLLGKDKEGVLYWLNQATWDCDWYWGFGYISTFTNNKNPHLAKDINSHQHWNNNITGFRQDGIYIQHINESRIFEKTTLTERESWELSELMKSAYILKETAEVLGRGGAHLAYNPCKDIIINKTEVDRINKVVLPAIFKEVYKILTPTKEEVTK